MVRLDPLVREWLTVLTQRADTRAAALATRALELHELLSGATDAAGDCHHVYVRLIDVLMKLSSQHVGDEELDALESEATWRARIARLKQILEDDAH